MNNFYDLVFEIDTYLKTPDINSLNNITKIFSHKGIKKYFWNALCNNESIEHDKWFKLLTENDMFNIINSIEIERINDKDFVSFWQPIEYLEKVSLNLKDSNNQEQIQKILNELINSYYKLSEKKYFFHGHIYWLTFKILSNLDVKYFALDHLDFIRFVLLNNDKTLISGDLGGKFFEKIFETKNSEIINKFFDLILSFEFDKKSTSRDFKSLVESYWLRELTKDKVNLIPLDYKRTVLEVALEKMNDILKYDEGAFNYIWFPSIEKSSQERFGASDISKVCIDLARDLLERIEPKNIYKKVEFLIKNKNTIFKRLAIHTINHHYDDLKEIFWSIDYNLIDESELNHELYKLFENHKDDFSEDEAKKIIHWNESQDFEYLKKLNEYNKYKDNWINSDKRKILYALKDSEKHPIFKEEFEKYDAKLKIQDEHPEFNSYSESFAWIEDESPISSKQLLEMNLEDLIKKINEFKEPNKFGNKANKIGLGREIEKTIADNYERFINKLISLLNIPIDYQHYILRALNSNIKSFSSEELSLYINYINQLINDFEYKEEYNPLVFEFSEFISKISSSESNIQIEKETANKVINIFDELKEKIKYYVPSEPNKSDILNSNEGQFYSSIITFSLKIARDKLNNDEKIRWNQKLKEIIESDLDTKKSFQLFEVIGRYLPNLFYLDEEWIKSKLEYLFMTDIDIHVESAYKGYFSNNTVYLQIFEKLNSKGIIDKALNYNFKEKINKKVVEFICISFISDSNDELIYKVINNGDYEQKQKLIQFFQNRGAGKDIDIKKHLIPLWNKLLVSLEDKEFKPLYNELLQWINAIKDIDKELYDLIIKTIEKIESFPMYHADILRNIYKLADNNINEVANILILLLEKFDFYIYQNEKLIIVVESIYKSELKEEANKIVNILGEKGNYSFKKLYVDNNLI